MLFFIFKVRVAISARWSLSASRTLQEVVIYREKKKKARALLRLDTKGRPGTKGGPAARGAHHVG